jgi:hypothetical protein
MHLTFKIKKMKNLLRIQLVFFCFISNPIYSQNEFFNSNIKFSDNQFNKFYSSFSIDSSQVYFNANDYYIYAYDKQTGTLNWSYYLANKTNTSPIAYQNNLIVSNYSSENVDKCVQLNSKTGDTIHTLVIQSINSKPFFKENIMYCTGIDNGYGGAVMAYDLKKNSVIWGKFIAHGVDKQPYYLKDKIIANAEEDNWFELDYNGKLIDTTCGDNTNLFVDDIKCVQNYIHRTHDNKGITQSFLKEYFVDYENLKVSSNNNYTFLLSNSKLMILKDNLEIVKQVNVDGIVTLPEKAINGYREILKIDDTTIWFFYKNLLVVYDYINEKSLNTYNLSSWNPHQIILDGHNVWLISRIDGQLHGLNLNESLNEKALVRTSTPTISGRIKILKQKLIYITGNYRTPGGLPKMYYKSIYIDNTYKGISIETISHNSESESETEGYMVRISEQFFNPADIISISDETTNKSDPLGIIIIHLKPGSVTFKDTWRKLEKQNNSEKLNWTENEENIVTDEIGIVFPQDEPNNFIEIKKALEELKILYENY